MRRRARHEAVRRCFLFAGRGCGLYGAGSQRRKWPEGGGEKFGRRDSSRFLVSMQPVPCPIQIGAATSCTSQVLGDGGCHCAVQVKVNDSF